jgi:hypothetical protein
MSKAEILTELRSLQAKCDAIRQEFGYSSPGRVTYMATLDVSPDEMVLVEADGFGGATTNVVEGNYPIDYVTKFERFFPSQIEAESAAEELACHRGSLREILAASA